MGNLHQSWERTRSHLAAARACLSHLPEDTPALVEHSEYLEHNELELAFESLAGFADNPELSAQMRPHLILAAKEMGLSHRVSELELG